MVRNILLYNLNPVDADIIISSTKIPDLLVSLLIMGTISSSVLPVAARVDAKSKSHTISEYLNVIYLSIMGVLGFFSLIIIFFTPQFLEWTTSQDLLDLFVENDVMDRYVWMTRILLLGPLAFATQGVFGIYLTLKERFTVYSWSGAIYNIGTIVGILIFSRYNELVYAPAWGMMIGAMVASGVYIYEASRFGYTPINVLFLTQLRPNWHRFKGEFWDTWKVFLPRIFLLNGLVLGNLLINRISDGTPGQITAVDIALSIQGVFFSLITSVSTVFFPNFAKTLHSDTSTNEFFWRRLFTFMRGVGVLAIIGTFGTIVFSPLVLWIFELFGRGQDNAEYIILITRISAFAIVFQSLVEIVSKYIYVKERVWQPAIISITALALQLITTLGMRYLLEIDPGISVSVGIVINFAVTFVYMYIIAMKDRKKDLLDSQK